MMPEDGVVAAANVWTDFSATVLRRLATSTKQTVKRLGTLRLSLLEVGTAFGSGALQSRTPNPPSMATAPLTDPVTVVGLCPAEHGPLGCASA